MPAKGTRAFWPANSWAEMMSIGMQKGLAFLTFWSAISGTFGYMDHDDVTGTNLKLPTYYHFQLLANQFRGRYAPLHNLTVTSGSGQEIKAFGAKDTNQIAVMILNQQSAAAGDTPLAYTVRLNTTGIVGANALQINIDAGVASEYTSPGTEPLSPESTVLLLFNAQGGLTRKFVYTLDHARLNQGPQLQ